MVTITNSLFMQVESVSKLFSGFQQKSDLLTPIHTHFVALCTPFLKNKKQLSTAEVIESIIIQDRCIIR
jgi:hypothetical protein